VHKLWILNEKWTPHEAAGPKASEYARVVEGRSDPCRNARQQRQIVVKRVARKRFQSPKKGVNLVARDESMSIRRKRHYDLESAEVWPSGESPKSCQWNVVRASFTTSTLQACLSDGNPHLPSSGSMDSESAQPTDLSCRSQGGLQLIRELKNQCVIMEISRRLFERSRAACQAHR
jgi:hypothetical protein